MERIMKAQTFADNSQHSWMKAKKTMEINPRHPIIQELKKRSAEDKNDKSLVDLAQLLYDSALVASGFHMDAPSEFANRIHRVLSLGLKIDPNAPISPEEESESSENTESSEGSDESFSADEILSKLNKHQASETESLGKDEL